MARRRRACILRPLGLDPPRDKGAGGADTFQQSRVARAVDEAEQSLVAMKHAALRARDRKVEARVEQFQSVAAGCSAR